MLKFSGNIFNASDSCFRKMFEFCPEGVLVLNPGGVIRGINRAMEDMTEWKRDEVVGRECLLLFQCRDDKGNAICPARCPGQRASDHPGSVFHTEHQLRKKSGQEIVVSATYRTIPYGDGLTIGVMREITREKRDEKRIRRLAITDELTGLYNFRYFCEQLDLEIKRARRYQRLFSLIMIDIDHFKYYNDLHGHPEGNVTLRQLARAILKRTRETNVVSRYGGEEFMILLPETGKSLAILTAERLRMSVRRNHYHHEEMQPGGDFTISIGVATFPTDADTADSLIKTVDESLYRAKKAGRDCVRWKEES